MRNNFRPYYKKVNYDGYNFDSEDEYKYYLYLKKRLEEGSIEKLVVHQSYLLIPKFMTKSNKQILPMTYEADFTFYDKELNKDRVIDIKGFEEEHFKIKKKIFEYIYCMDKYDELEVLTYRKTLGGFVPISEVKKMMKTKRQQLIEEKNKYKDALKEKEKLERKKEKEIYRLKELKELKNNGIKLTKQQQNRLNELLDRYKDLYIL